MEKMNRLTREQLRAALYYLLGRYFLLTLFKRELEYPAFERAFFYFSFDIMLGMLPETNSMNVGDCIGGTQDDWECKCGNDALHEGFLPCDINGEKVDPTPQDWPVAWYVCGKCGRIIRQEDQRIVGVGKIPEGKAS